jgi:uncharacterized damage-inducible protein DinB
MSPVELLLAQLDLAYSRHSWHGTNLRGSLRGLSPEIAAWKPAQGRHSVQEIVVHCAYWKYTVVRRLTGEKRGSFSLKGSNWFARDGADVMLWRADLSLLDAEHRRLRELVSSLTTRALERPTPGGRPLHEVVSGIIAHDLYHAGQIQALKALYKARGRS